MATLLVMLGIGSSILITGIGTDGNVKLGSLITGPLLWGMVMLIRGGLMVGVPEPPPPPCELGAMGSVTTLIDDVRSHSEINPMTSMITASLLMLA
jgi:hypothetical protein